MINLMMARFVFNIIFIVVIVTGSEFSDTHYAEIDRFLKKLNKPALKSIKSPDGDIIDCVHMKNHPIYDHPLLKNHTIQMRPSSYPEGWNNEFSDTDKQSMVTQLWTINGRCPKNSIPIRRTKREDILRAKSIERYMRKYPNNIPRPKSSNSTSNNYNEYAQTIVNGKFHGAKGIINVWKPYVQTSREFSQAQMWVRGGSYSELNSIEFGWQVYQDHYGDDNPRHFIYWTADGYKSGCFNLDCPGFVPVERGFALGAAVSNVSTLGGNQYIIPTSIWKEPRTGNWWLKVNDHMFVGYWPSILFKQLKDSATEIQWGGEILNFKDGSQHTTTTMGSGRFAEGGYRKSSYFRNLEIVDEIGITSPPQGGYSSVTDGSCYNLRTKYDARWGIYFYYGGPGRNRECK